MGRKAKMMVQLKSREKNRVAYSGNGLGPTAGDADLEESLGEPDLGLDRPEAPEAGDEGETGETLERAADGDAYEWPAVAPTALGGERIELVATVLEEYAPDDERLRVRRGDEVGLLLLLLLESETRVGEDMPPEFELTDIDEAVGRENTEEGLSPGRTEEPLVGDTRPEADEPPGDVERAVEAGDE
jgi:hypothetical protein